MKMPTSRHKMAAACFKCPAGIPCYLHAVQQRNDDQEGQTKIDESVQQTPTMPKPVAELDWSQSQAAEKIPRRA
jgi:hypothetical protein